ncbi:MAG TPA: flagellar biosynthesis regulatory protein FlaF [Alphaproteobacteria bacterium]|nr:flagellar biosynthesis regulatory protein FlaF [Alphaproteobacteria bacterium]
MTTESSAMPQNELEARALVRTASRLNGIKERWPVESEELNEALSLNRKLWTILVTGATEASNPLPIEVKQNIFNLAHFIFKHTFAVMAKPSAQSLDVLININMNIARGLNEQSLRRAEEAGKAPEQK